jgi:PAS domain S-box-containing protein
LSIDDDPAIRLLCRVELEADGFEVVEAANGRDALRLMEGGHPDVILLHATMPDMDGWELLRWLKAHPDRADVPVILLTARGDAESRLRAADAGVDEYFSKPFRPEDLRAAITRVTDSSPERRFAYRQERRDALQLGQDRASQWLAAIVESSEDAIVSKTLDGVITSWNRAAETIYGYSPDECIGRHISLIIPAEALNDHELLVERVRQGERVDHHVTTRVRKDGRRLQVAVTISPVLDRRGTPVGISAISRDLTEHNRSGLLFQSMVDAAPDAMVVVDERGTIELVNRQTERLFGYHRDHLLGRPVEVLVPERFRERHPRHRDAYAATPRVRPMGAHRDGPELSGLRADGTEFPVEISLSPLEREEGLLVLAAVRDATERRHAEAVLKRAIERERNRGTCLGVQIGLDAGRAAVDPHRNGWKGGSRGTRSRRAPGGWAHWFRPWTATERNQAEWTTRCGWNGPTTATHCRRRPRLFSLFFADARCVATGWARCPRLRQPSIVDSRPATARGRPGRPSSRRGWTDGSGQTSRVPAARRRRRVVT